ncbi:MAG TPA: hemerythrin domain-containing protein [Gammaproteobacteria bacterium]|nr:hemerythrin domain-containing protein [Gammaproteobacteria bacterium]
MDAIALLLKDHQRLKKLLKQLVNTSQRATQKRHELFTIIRFEAKLHETMEEKFLYKHLREMKQSFMNAFEHTEEVSLMNHVLLKMVNSDFSKDAWSAKANVLMEISANHIAKEEDEKFPQAIKLFTQQDLDQIGAQMRRFKERHSIKK